MSIRAAETLDRATWNERIRGSGGSFLQSWEWGSFQERLGRRVFHVESSGTNALVLRNPLPLGLSYCYLPRGPASDLSGSDILDSLVSEVRRVVSGHPIFLRVEPTGHVPTERLTDLLRARGFVRSPDAQPRLTRVIDLTKPEEAILADMEHNTRYAIRAAGKRGVAVRTIIGSTLLNEAFPLFWELFRDTAERHELKSYPEHYYRELFAMEGECAPALLLAEHDSRYIAAAVPIFFGREATYLFAASRGGYGRLNAPSLILWELIRAAKARECTTLDLGGVSDTKKRWRGVTAFKRSFGGRDVSFVGTWDLPLRQAWYALYRAGTAFREVV